MFTHLHQILSMDLSLRVPAFGFVSEWKKTNGAGVSAGRSDLGDFDK